MEPNHRPMLHTREQEQVSGAPGVSNGQHSENNLVSDSA
jgi:hypothetical protein